MPVTQWFHYHMQLRWIFHFIEIIFLFVAIFLEFPVHLQVLIFYLLTEFPLMLQFKPRFSHVEELFRYRWIYLNYKFPR